MIDKILFNDAENAIRKHCPIKLDPKQLHINILTGRILQVIKRMEAEGYSDEEIDAVIKPATDQLVALLKEKES